MSWADQQEMKRMLKAIGLEANILPYNATYEDIMKIPAAEYNISVCQTAGFAQSPLWQERKRKRKHLLRQRVMLFAKSFPESKEKQTGFAPALQQEPVVALPPQLLSAITA